MQALGVFEIASEGMGEEGAEVGQGFLTGLTGRGRGGGGWLGGAGGLFGQM
jgi:hypothetical protein